MTCTNLWNECRVSQEAYKCYRRNEHHRPIARIPTGFFAFFLCRSAGDFSPASKLPAAFHFRSPFRPGNRVCPARALREEAARGRPTCPFEKKVAAAAAGWTMMAMESMLQLVLVNWYAIRIYESSS